MQVPTVPVRVSSLLLLVAIVIAVLGVFNVWLGTARDVSLALAFGFAAMLIA